MAQKRIMPIKADIFIHWFNPLMIDYGKYWIDAIYDENNISESQKINRSHAKKVIHLCFACGSETGTERCHIEPKCVNGGIDNVENLHLLCKECHLESESIENKDVYFEWFCQKSPMNSGSSLRVLNKVKLYEQLINQGKGDLLPDYLRSLF